MNLRNLLAALLTAVPWLSAAAQSPQVFYQPIQQQATYQIVPAPMALTNPFANLSCFAKPTPAAVPVAVPSAQQAFVPAPIPAATAVQTAWVGVPGPGRQYAWGPTPVGVGLAWVGQRMVTLGQRHVWTVQHTKFVRWPQQQTAVYYEAVAAPVQYQAVPSAQQAFVPATSPQMAVVSDAAPAPPQAPAPAPPKP